MFCDPAEVVRGLFEAFADRDVERVLAAVDAEVEFWPEGTARRRGRGEPYRGHAGMREYLDDVAGVWERLEVRPGELRGVANAVVAFGVALGRTHAGEDVEVPVIWVFKLREGRILSGRVVETASEAIREAERQA